MQNYQGIMTPYYQFIEYNDKKLLVKRIIRESHLKKDFDQKILKKWTKSDVLLRKDGMFYCCETIQEAKIIDPEEKQ